MTQEKIIKHHEENIRCKEKIIKLQSQQIEELLKQVDIKIQEIEVLKQINLKSKEIEALENS